MDRREEAKIQIKGRQCFLPAGRNCRDLPSIQTAAEESSWPCMFPPLVQKESSSWTFWALNCAAGTSAISKRTSPITTHFPSR